MATRTRINTKQHETMASTTASSDLGAAAFASKNYNEALRHYLNALEDLPNDNENRSGTDRTKRHQVLLSNVIACRLKIGGDEMIERAVDEAKECIALDPSWAKAHIRLASAYIAQGGRSNDACQELQRAISLDSQNKVARDMLVQELRRRDCGSSDAHATGGSAPSAPPLNDLPPNATAPTEATDTAPPAQEDSTTRPNPSANYQSQPFNNVDIDDINTNPPVHNTFNSFSEQMQHYLARAIAWYHSQSDDKKTLLKVSTCFILLYLALGGRFGLEYAVGKKTRGNYAKGNVYDKYRASPQTTGRDYYESTYNNGQSSSTHNYYNDRSNPQNEQYAQRQQQQSSHTSSSSPGRSSSHHNSAYNDRSNPRNNQYYSQYDNHYSDYYERPRRTTTRSSNTSFNLFDGSLPSMAILFIIGAVCHRFGINPFHIFMMLNMAQNRGRHHGRGVGRMYGRGGGFGYGGGGFRFGGRRNRFGQRGGYY